MAHYAAAGVNGSNRILTHGAPQPRMMPNGCLGSPVLVLLRSLQSLPHGCRTEVDCETSLTALVRAGPRYLPGYYPQSPSTWRQTNKIDSRSLARFEEAAALLWCRQFFGGADSYRPASN